MKNISTLLMLAAIGCPAFMVSCSDNAADEPAISFEGQPIRFAADATPLGRVAMPPYTTASLDTFTVYAYPRESTKPFMDSVTVGRSASGTWSYAPEQYWPGYPLDFYAYAPAGWVGPSGPLSPVSYDNILADNDLIYSVVSGAGTPTAGGAAQVSLNFSHALARATFNMASTDSLIEVKMSHLTVHGLFTHGVFSFPERTGGTGSWSGLANRRYHMLYLALHNDDIITLTPAPTEYYTPGARAQFFIPQTLDSDTTDYAEVQIQIFDRATGNMIWPNANTPAENITQGMIDTGHLRFKLATDSVKEWKAGHHYIYNIFINSAPGLDPIKFGSPTVDNYVRVQVTEP